VPKLARALQSRDHVQPILAVANQPRKTCASGPPARFPAITPEQVARLDVAAPRYTSYPTVPVWGDDFGHDAYAAALARAATVDAPLSLYVHIPFCREMCTYCGCNVIISRDPAKRDRYLDNVDRELALVASHLGARRNVARIHLGGGTPTSMDEAQLERLYRSIADRFTILPDAELALEIDPAVTTRGQLALLRQLGWRRISMGVQDFDPLVQRAVNRVQSVAETRQMVDGARDLGFDSVNLDLIYGLPHQLPVTMVRSMRKVVELRPDRISMFSFAYVPQLKPHQRRLPMAHLATGFAKLELFRAAHDTLAEAGYLAIGMDHFALPSDELAIAQREGRLHRDFQGYTVRAAAADTVAFGVSSISAIGGAYAQNSKSLQRYENALAHERLPIELGHQLTEDDEARRALIGTLMCNLEVDLGPDAATVFADELARLPPLEAEGLCVRDGNVVRLTALGRVFARNVASVFDAYLHAAPPDKPTFSRTV
jgi:oxygen-independent coproporphyrinogen-3 oxidase